MSRPTPPPRVRVPDRACATSAPVRTRGLHHGPRAPRTSILAGGVPTAGLVAALLVTGCVGITPAGAAGPHRDRAALVEGMSRTWVLNVDESETWEEGWVELVKQRAALSGRTVSGVGLFESARRAARGGLGALVGVAPATRLAVSPGSVSFHPRGLDSLRVPLAAGADDPTGDHASRRDGAPGGPGRTGGAWVEDGFRVERVIDAETAIVEVWRLAPTGERLVVDRTVTYPGYPQVTYTQVYDRYRERGGGSGGAVRP